MAAYDKEATHGMVASSDPTDASLESETVLHNGNIIGKTLFDHEVLSHWLT